MVARAYTVAFEGVDARIVEVQCAVAPGLPAFSVVGLPDKAVSEARERVRAALTAMSIALPSKRITINLSPADLPKEGSHFDLPIALALLAALDIIPREDVEATVSLGELSLDGSLIAGDRRVARRDGRGGRRPHPGLPPRLRGRSGLGRRRPCHRARQPDRGGAAFHRPARSCPRQTPAKSTPRMQPAISAT